MNEYGTLDNSKTDSVTSIRLNLVRCIGCSLILSDHFSAYIHSLVVLTLLSPTLPPLIYIVVMKDSRWTIQHCLGNLRREFQWWDLNINLFFKTRKGIQGRRRTALPSNIKGMNFTDNPTTFNNNQLRNAEERQKTSRIFTEMILIVWSDIRCLHMITIHLEI